MASTRADILLVYQAARLRAGVWIPGSRGKGQESLNRIYRLVWNAGSRSLVAAAEIARGRGKGQGDGLRSLLRAIRRALGGASQAGKHASPCGAARPLWAVSLLGLAMSAPALAQPPLPPGALPTGGQVIAGQAAIGRSGNQMTVSQASDKAILHWTGFDIGSQARVAFQQPSASAVALNRVLAGDASRIEGQLSANGQVWLVNPNGVIFGQGARVDVGGLVASTLDTTNEDFLAGKAVFRRNGATGAIENRGTITAADGGTVALLSPEVTNEGTISARMGHVVLAGGDRVAMDVGADGLLKVSVDPATIRSLIDNRQLIVADGGEVVMTNRAAAALGGGGVANSGTIQARTLAEKDGRILLLADMGHGEVRAAGRLEARFIETSAAKVYLDPGLVVDTQGGEWLIDPTDITIDTVKAGAIQTALASGAVTVTTADSGNNSSWGGGTNPPSGGDPGDIHVNAPITWSANKLTLTANRDININAVMTMNGGSMLDMNAGRAVKVGFAPGDGNGFAGRIDIPARSGAGILAINGQGYYVIDSLGSAADWITAGNYTLQGLAHASMRTGRYALGADIDASATSGWNGGAGFVAIGTNSNIFTGAFNGLGHKISGLAINRTGTDYIGLFGYADNASISNIGIDGGNLRGGTAVGGLVGSGSGTNVESSYATGGVSGAYYVGGLIGSDLNANIKNSYATNSVTGSGNNVGGIAGQNTNVSIENSYALGSVAGNQNVGGLAGQSAGNSAISSSHATGNVSGSAYVGGLVGVKSGGSIADSHATGIVTASATYAYAGGLVGKHSAGNIINSYASGDVSGISVLGGLVGWQGGGSIADSHATGNVSASASTSVAGGLVGQNTGGNISNSYASGGVSGIKYLGGLIGQKTAGDLSDSHAEGGVTSTAASGDSYAGGLIGQNTAGGISNSYATGNVTGKNQTGGLVGSNENASSVISGSHATGTVSGAYNVGGLIGYNNARIENSHFLGSVAGGGSVGGLVGYNVSANINNSYATNSVTGSANDVGGLVGYNLNSSITGSYATNNVTGGGSYTGGLIGTSTGSSAISGSHATGVVSGGNFVGGLVGQNTGGNISDSHATGNVSGGVYVGGLVGRKTAGNLSGSYAEGTVVSTLASGESYVGGLVGQNTNGDISDSHASGDVTGKNRAGGLVGDATGGISISDSHATGSVTGATYVGGLVGFNNNASIGNSHATGSITGSSNIGGLVGYNVSTSIGNSYATGSVTGTSNLGGLAGLSTGSSAISNSHATGVVSGATVVGGLVGLLTGGSIAGSHATGNVMATDTNSYAGGLVGRNMGGGISGSQASGDVSAKRTVGGLVGSNEGATSVISNSHASGTVNGTISVGGLVGFNQNTASISRSYATGNVTGTNYVGGLGGYNNDASIEYSFAAGNASGANWVGGLVGQNIRTSGTSTISDSYALGNVSASGTGVNGKAGGLAGSNEGSGASITRSYAAGAVAGGAGYSGGLVGYNNAGSVSNSYWDTETTGQATSSGGGTGRDSASMKQSATFAGWNFATDWRIYEGRSYPFLLALRQDLTVTANDASKTYDGLAWSGGNGIVFSVGGTPLSGALSWSGDSQGAIDAGSYAMVPSIAMSQLEYQVWNVTYHNGTLTVGKAALTVTANDASKTYDGLAWSGGNGVGYSGFVNGETAAVLGGSLVWGGTSQGAVNAGSYTIVPSGQTSGNYTITYHDGTLTILPVQVSQTTLAEESVWRAMHQQMTGLHPHVPGFDSPGPCLNADGGRATPEACAGMQTSLTRDRTALISIVMP